MTMYAAHHVTKLCTGHSCFPPRPSATGAISVYINDTPAHRINDKWLPHCCYSSCHDAYTLEGTTRCWTEDIPQSLVTHKVSCTSKIMTGSFDVFIENVPTTSTS